MANDFDSDAMLAFMGELNRSVQNLSKSLADIGNQSGTGMKKAGDEFEKFGQSVKKHADTSVKAMNVGLKEMASTLVGPVGIAVGLYKVGEALDTFAVGQMRLQNFARDAGYTSTSIQRLQAAGEHMGYTIEETNQIVKDFGGTVNELHLDRQASNLWRDLDRIRDGGHEVALTIERMKAAGVDNGVIQEYVADLIVKQLRRQTDEGNRAAQALSNAFKMPISYAEQLVGAKAKIKDDDILILTPEQRKKQEQYNDAWIDMKRKFWRDVQDIEQATIETLVEADKKHKEAGGAFNPSARKTSRTRRSLSKDSRIGGTERKATATRSTRTNAIRRRACPTASRASIRPASQAATTVMSCRAAQSRPRSKPMNSSTRKKSQKIFWRKFATP